MSTINTQEELERLCEKLSDRFNNYQCSVKEHAPAAVRNKLWEMVLHAQFEVEVIKDEVERQNRLQRNHIPNSHTKG